MISASSNGLAVAGIVSSSTIPASAITSFSALLKIDVYTPIQMILKINPSTVR